MKRASLTRKRLDSTSASRSRTREHRERAVNARLGASRTRSLAAAAATRAHLPSIRPRGCAPRSLGCAGPRVEEGRWRGGTERVGAAGRGSRRQDAGSRWQALERTDTLDASDDLETLALAAACLRRSSGASHGGAACRCVALALSQGRTRLRRRRWRRRWRQEGAGQNRRYSRLEHSRTRETVSREILYVASDS
jgi:hypothetical protein